MKQCMAQSRSIDAQHTRDRNHSLFSTDRLSIVLSPVGAAEILYKPFHLKSLHAMMQRHLSVNREPSQPDPLGPSRPSILSFRHRDRFLRPTKRPGA